ncbi:MAG: hypothetical protein HY314_06430 [Acidobacteria bacterium]|nr:hypothetical protein [Acidobacteriota bacterium]
MTKEELLIELERRLGPLDQKTRGVVSVTVDLIQQSQSSPTASVPEPQFQGENPPYPVAAQLSLEDRARVLNELEERNRDWLRQRCQQLGAGWLLVIDGDVMLHGPTLDNYPTDEELLNLYQRTGKLPLLFVDDRLLAIEETATWSFHIKRGMIWLQDWIQSPIRTKISTSVSPTGA